jgi:hypothetical protein
MQKILADYNQKYDIHYFVTAFLFSRQMFKITN